MRGDGAAFETLRRWQAAGDEVATTEVNFFETALGIELVQDQRFATKLAVAWAELLGTVEVIPLTRRVTQLAVRRQGQLYRAGRPASYSDLMIAAAAKLGGCERIVTRNESDFKQIGLLPVEGH